MAMKAARAVLKPTRTALFICDIQERIIKAIHEFENITQNSARLVNMENITNNISEYII